MGLARREQHPRRSLHPVRQCDIRRRGRVCGRASAGETQVCKDACAHLTWARNLLAEAMNAEHTLANRQEYLLSREGVVVVDCKSLFDAVTKLTQQLEEVPTHLQGADGLTKRDAKIRNLLRDIMENPVPMLYKLPSRSASSVDSRAKKKTPRV